MASHHKENEIHGKGPSPYSPLDDELTLTEALEEGAAEDWEVDEDSSSESSLASAVFWVSGSALTSIVFVTEVTVLFLLLLSLFLFFLPTSMSSESDRVVEVLIEDLLTQYE